MMLQTTPEEESFRAEVRDWLQTNAPKEPRPTEGSAMRAYDMGWQKTQFEGGWAGISWPKAFGGRGLSLVEQVIWYEEYARAHAPRIGCGFVGVNHGGPTLIAKGTPEQQQRHLPRILRGEEVWCQGFSEPGAGSDLASLRTRGVIDGDHLVVNGSKIWTSYAQVADFQELLVRTDPDAPKHKGITWAICDMTSPGIELRPILTMVGPDDFHFCQVFYNDVRIPLSNVVGAVNDGWNMANATLGFERGTAFMAEQIHYSEIVEQLIQLAGETTGPDGESTLLQDGEIASRLATARAEMAAMRAMTYATVSRAARGSPGSEGSLTRLFFAEATQRISKLSMDILGSQSLVLGGDAGWTRSYMRNFAQTIAAGSSDVQRNIIGERVLGLPKGPKAS
jgi:alkylation response protein AidB-like acyl-CoA dehydrogenase